MGLATGCGKTRPRLRQVVARFIDPSHLLHFFLITLSLCLNLLLQFSGAIRLSVAIEPFMDRILICGAATIPMCISLSRRLVLSLIAKRPTLLLKLLVILSVSCRSSLAIIY